MIFTFDEPGWFLGYFGDPSEAVIGSDFGYHSAPNALALGPGSSVLSGSANIYGTLTIVPLVVGKTYLLRAWIDGDLADESTPLQVIVTNGDTDYFLFVLNKSQVGSGMRLVQLGTFVLTQEATELYLTAGLSNSSIQDPPNPTTGRWVIDDIEIREPLPVEALVMARKVEAMDALTDALKAVDGTDGYRSNLGGRIYEMTLLPDDRVAGVELPYGHLRTLPEPTHTDGNDDLIVLEWVATLHVMLAESATDRTKSTARRAAYILADDMRLVQLKNPTLGGTVVEIEFLGLQDEDAGVFPTERWVEVIAPFRLKQYVDLDSLQT